MSRSTSRLAKNTIPHKLNIAKYGYSAVIMSITHVILFRSCRGSIILMTIIIVSIIAIIISSRSSCRCRSGSSIVFFWVQVQLLP